MQSDLGLTPNNDGRVIRLQVPQLTAVGAALQLSGSHPGPVGNRFRCCHGQGTRGSRQAADPPLLHAD